MKKTHLLFSCLCVLFFSCTRIDLYEKLTPIPKHAWNGNFLPRFSFDISDTLSDYQLFLLLRHNDRYNYNNIWVNVFIKAPDGTVQKFQIEKLLATNTGWLGTGMDDIYYHRLPLTSAPIQLKKAGRYIFSIQHIMREEPLQNVMDVGLRIEKKP